MDKIEIYDNIYLQTPEGQIETDRIKLFIPISAISEDGSIGTVSIGNNMVDNEHGYTFIVDNHIGEQFEKLKIAMEGFSPVLLVKEGETITNNKTPEEIEIEKMKQELAIKEAELRSKSAPN